MKHITQEQFKLMPWKNGGGMTTEIYRLDGKTPEGYYFRLSMAKIENDGPFSQFEGYDRHLILLEGNGCILDSNGKQLALTNSSLPYSFAGERKIDCRLIEGPVTDFNIIINRKWGTAHVEISQDTKDQVIQCQDEMLFFFDLKEQELWILTNGEELKSKARKSITIRVAKLI
jgi:uncharacterized protein